MIFCGKNICLAPELASHCRSCRWAISGMPTGSKGPPAQHSHPIEISRIGVAEVERIGAVAQPHDAAVLAGTGLVGAYRDLQAQSSNRDAEFIF